MGQKSIPKSPSKAKRLATILDKNKGIKERMKEIIRQLQSKYFKESRKTRNNG